MSCFFANSGFKFRGFAVFNEPYFYDLQIEKHPLVQISCTSRFLLKFLVREGGLFLTPEIIVFWLF